MKVVAIPPVARMPHRAVYAILLEKRNFAEAVIRIRGSEKKRRKTNKKKLYCSHGRQKRFLCFYVGVCVEILLGRFGAPAGCPATRTGRDRDGKVTPPPCA